MARPLVLLHGFTQTGRSWDAVRRELGGDVLAPDLRGHGAATERRPIDTGHLVADVLALAPARFVLAGYSMGGRLALHVALAPRRGEWPDWCSSRPRPASSPPRSGRRGGRPTTRWPTRSRRPASRRSPHAGPPSRCGPGSRLPCAAPRRRRRRRQDPAGLAASLRGFGTGAMAPVWDRLGELTMPAVVLAGERDAKFRAIGERLAAALPAARLVVVPAAGHALTLEAPGAVAAELAAVAGR
ncbi:MAG: alpha/beta fold hydrolase [Solirubrobacterales bacterium]